MVQQRFSGQFEYSLFVLIFVVLLLLTTSGCKTTGIYNPSITSDEIERINPEPDFPPPVFISKEH